jgi:hypothetical protein
MPDDAKGGLDGVPELLAEHGRLLEEKTRLRASGQTPPTKINYDMTNTVNEIVERAKGQKSEELRSLLLEEAERGSLAADQALEWLVEEDPWWSGREGR